VRVLVCLVFLSACAPVDRLTVHADPALADALTSFVAFIDDDRVTLDLTVTPESTSGAGQHVAVLQDAALCDECFVLSGDGDRSVVRGAAPLGVQYGLAQVLEDSGYRFFHPWAGHAPAAIEAPDRSAWGDTRQPEMTRRGIHLHTLHPIEGYFAVWGTGEANEEGAARIIDWVIKNRGNHLQWVGLDDIIDSSIRLAGWQEHTATVLAEAGRRGVTTGLGIQLYGSGNLQQAFDLLDAPLNKREQIEERLAMVTEATPFDLYHLSFGEFNDAPPGEFLADVNLAFEVLQEQAPGAEMASLVHVGADLLVEYEGEDWIYYLLAQFADPGITTWVHTVMYYNLYDDPGGSYHHEDYDAHRQLLHDRLGAGEPVGYFPESAYWIAFDNSIPTYLPVYVKSRWRDLAETRAAVEANGWSPLVDHTLFSSGWEWGYWQTDVATLRMGWALPDDYGSLYEEMFAPWGDAGAAAATALTSLAELQYEALIVDRLGAYLSSKDSTMEIGYSLDIISQPKRPSYGEIADMSQGERDAFRSDVVEPLRTLATEHWAIYEAVLNLDVDRADPWFAELRDGISIDALRAEFIAQVMEAAADHADGVSTDGWNTELLAVLADARQVVGARHAAMHHPDPARLTEPGANATIYQYGYLIRADELCYWEREQIRLGNLIDGFDDAAPGCAL